MRLILSLVLMLIIFGYISFRMVKLVLLGYREYEKRNEIKGDLLVLFILLTGFLLLIVNGSYVGFMNQVFDYLGIM